MAFVKGSLGDNQKVKEYTDGLEGRVDSAFKEVEDKTKAGFENITPTEESSVTIGGTKFYTGSKEIRFKVPFVGRAPSVTATVNSAGSHFMNVGVTAVGRNSFTLHVNRINKLETGVYWVATQQTE